MGTICLNDSGKFRYFSGKFKPAEKQPEELKNQKTLLESAANADPYKPSQTEHANETEGNRESEQLSEKFSPVNLSTDLWKKLSSIM